LKKEGTIWVNIGDSYWGGGWRNAEFNEHSGEIQKGSKGTYCGKSMPNLKGYVNGYKPKDLIGIPWMLAFALRADGWYLRQDIIWHKPNPMPESVTDRCTKAHEYIFLLSKSKDYYFAYEEIQEDAVTAENRPIGIVRERELDYNTKRKNNPEAYLQTPRTKNCQYDGQAPNSMHIRREMGMKDVQYTTRNKRDVWSVCVKPNKETHFATYPESLVVPCIKAGCPENGVVLDPFMGSGTTGIVARKLNRNFVGTELNPEYQKMAERRIFNEGENLFNL
jgi:DNA modification methylase